MRYRYATALMAVLVMLMATAPVTAERLQQQTVCAVVDIGTDAIEPGNLFDSVLSVQSFSDLRLRVRFQTAIIGQHLLELHLITPHGHHYQTLTAPISTSREHAGSERRLAGFPRGLPVQVLQSYRSEEGKQLGTVLNLPVAGTTIVSSSLYGSWRVEILLDGEEISCPGASSSFTITE